MAHRDCTNYAAFYALIYWTDHARLSAPGSLVTPLGCYQLAQQFKAQAEDAQRTLDALDPDDDDEA
jgi:hypothetical protein